MFIRESLKRNGMGVCCRVVLGREVNSTSHTFDETMRFRNVQILTSGPRSYTSSRIRGFSTAPGVAQSSLDESEFHEVADKTLEELIDCLSKLEDSIEDLDVELSQGVLNISIESKKVSWVINKQTPNRQLWWSSPKSGPRRYEWINRKQKDELSKIEHATQWVHSKEDLSPSKDGIRKSLFDVLRSEMLEVTGLDIKN